MFTGIIEEIGRVQHITSGQTEIQVEKILEETKIGDSISVNGVCLTVTKLSDKSFCADISPETMRVTALGCLKAGDYVNLERAMALSGRFGGHIVTGHTDGRGKFTGIKHTGEFYEMEFELNNEQSRYVVKKGSISINGISLTVANIDGNIVKIAVIPHTFDNTTLKYLKKDDFVNIEADILAKHVEKFLSTGDNKSRIDYVFLQENGYL